MRRLLILAICIISSFLYADNFNADWKFKLGDDKAYSHADFDYSKWRSLALPHDWSVEFAFSENLEGCTGYLPGGIAWYAKEFQTPTKVGQKCFILFDGIYNNSQIWLNGKKVAERPYGYVPFYVDLTPYLNKEGKLNNLAVRVDHSRYADSRWYTGSGIYRNVELFVMDEVYVPIWGLELAGYNVSKDSAKLKVALDIKNESAKDSTLDVVASIYSPSGKKVGVVKDSIKISAKAEDKLVMDKLIEKPALWSVDEPNLYVVEVEIFQGDKLLTKLTDRTGFKTIKFDVDKGFFLNGKNMKIKGVCLHHDGGLVGAAVPREVWQRRLATLKEAGCNAIRSSHNPASKEFIELCDEMGFLFQEEFFDEWDYPKDKRLNMNEKSVDYITRGYVEHFHKWAKADLTNVMLRDRNHISIFQWSIGNEIEWTYQGNKESTGFFGADAQGGYFWNPPPYSKERIRKNYQEMEKAQYQIGKTAQMLADWVRELDTTKPVIANCILPSISFESGFIDALDIAGFSYRRVMYDYAKENYPNKPIMGTENVAQWHEWKAVEERDFVSGIFLWTGIDYLGESNKKWPVKSTASGILDTAGFKEPSFFMMKSLWNKEEPTMQIYTKSLKDSVYELDANANLIRKMKGKHRGRWDQDLWVWRPVNNYWNYKDGEAIVVEVYTNSPDLELFLNGQSKGKKYLKDQEDRVYKWVIAYEAGELLAKGTFKTQDVESKLNTSGEASCVELERDGMHIIAHLKDEAGNFVKHKEEKVKFKVQGGTIKGVDNGNEANITPFKSDTILTDEGKCLMILDEFDYNTKIEAEIVR